VRANAGRLSSKAGQGGLAASCTNQDELEKARRSYDTVVTRASTSTNTPSVSCAAFSATTQSRAANIGETKQVKPNDSVSLAEARKSYF
jgi:hypothetical protein